MAFAAAAVLTAITVSNLDVAVKGQLAAVRVEAGAKALALAPPRLPDGQNAAPIYRRAFAALTPPDQLPALLRRPGRGVASLRPDGVRPGRPRAAGVPRQPAARPGPAPRGGGDAPLRRSTATGPATRRRSTCPCRNCPHLRHGATLLAYDALARATRGDGKGALDDVAAIFGIARHIRYPLLIDLLTAARRSRRPGRRRWKTCWPSPRSRPDDLARLNVVAGEPYRERLRRTFAMEEAWGMAAFVMIATGRARRLARHPGRTPRWTRSGRRCSTRRVYRVFFLEDDLAAYRRHMRTMRDQRGPAGPGDARRVRQARSRRSRPRAAAASWPGCSSRPRYKVVFAALDGDATRGLVRLAVAAAAYKAKHGKYPEKLGRPGAGVPPGGAARPLRRPAAPPAAADGGVVLYSIGRDRKDDGGRAVDDPKQEGDLVFRLR